MCVSSWLNDFIHFFHQQVGIVVKDCIIFKIKNTNLSTANKLIILLLIITTSLDNIKVKTRYPGFSSLSKHMQDQDQANWLRLRLRLAVCLDIVVP